MELDSYDRIPTRSSTHISSAISRVTSPSTIETSCSPTQSAIKRFNEDDNVQDLIVYELEVVDKVEPKPIIADKTPYITVPNLVPFILIPLLISLVLISAILLAIATIGELNTNESTLTYGSACKSTLECKKDSGLVCDVSTSTCGCDINNRYYWKNNACHFCPQSWLLLNSSCYLISTLPSSYSNANKYCSNYNSNSILFIPNSVTEFDVISSLLKSLEPCSKCEFFMGCSDSSLGCLDNSNLKSLATSKECNGAGTSNGKCAILKYTKSPYELCIDYESCDTVKSGLSFICE